MIYEKYILEYLKMKWMLILYSEIIKIIDKNYFYNISLIYVYIYIYIIFMIYYVTLLYKKFLWWKIIGDDPKLHVKE